MGHRSKCQMLLKLNLKRKKSMFTVYYVFSVNPPTPTPHHLQKAIHFGMQQPHNLLDGGPDAKSITFKKTIKGAIFIYPLLFYPTLYSQRPVNICESQCFVLRNLLLFVFIQTLKIKTRFPVQDNYLHFQFISTQSISYSFHFDS